MSTGVEAAIEWLTIYRYWIIFPLALVEGPIIMMISGFLLKLGVFTFWPLYLVLMAGDLSADALWYTVGYYGGHPLVRKYGRFVSLSDELITKTENAFHRHQNKILFLSKITMGFGFALVVLVTAGVVRIPFRKYIAFNAVGQIAWTAILMGIGYFFGNLYLVVDEGLRIATAAAFTSIAIALLYGVNRYLRNRDIQNKL